MLSDKQKKLLAKEIKRLQTQGDFLPEDEALFKVKSPGPGLHSHDENNPFGMHRHELGATIDGAHTHTPQNPEGEHAHGEFKGMALIDGPHYHDKTFGDGWHNHTEDGEENTIVPQKP